MKLRQIAWKLVEKSHFTKTNFSAELRFLFDDTSVLLCATPCDRKIGAICAEKSSYTRVDGNQQGEKNVKKKNSFCLDTKRKKADWGAGVQRWLETCQNFSPIFASILFLALLRTRNKVSLLSHDSPATHHPVPYHTLVKQHFFSISGVK